MTIALGAAIVTAAFPSEERGKALGILGITISTGLLIGPVLGGFLLDILDWRAIFYTRIPIGIIGLVMAWLLLKEQKSPDTHLKFDLWGTVTLFGSLSCLLLFFNLGGRLGFVSLPALLLAGSTVILLTLFLMVERKVNQPIVDLSLFKNRLFATGNITLGIIYVSIAGYALLVPFYLIDGLGRSASEAGLLIATVPLTSLVIGPLSGWLSDKIGSRPLCIVGTTILCLGLFLLSRLGIESSNTAIVLGLVGIGIGSGMFQAPNSSSIMGSVQRDRISTASAMIATVRQMGMSNGIAIMGAIFTIRQLFHTTQLTQDTLNPQMLQRLSLIGGFQDALLVAAIACSIGILTSLIGKKKQPNQEIGYQKPANHT